MTLPLEVAETFRERGPGSDEGSNASAAAAQLLSRKGALRSVGPGWRNKLIWGDNLLAIGSLMERWAGHVDLIYIDPPFATGLEFSFPAEIGEQRIRVRKKKGLLAEKAYRDSWDAGEPAYLEMMAERLTLMRDLLSESGSLFLHCDWHVGHYLKVLCDSIFGRDHLVNELVWCYTGPGSPGMRQFNRKHDTIFWYRKADSWIFNSDEVRIEHHPKTKGNFKRGLRGSGFLAATYDLAAGGKIPEDWWQMAVAARYPVDGVFRTGYATEKPWPLIERIIRTASPEGGLVADFFSGSGTTCAVAERLGRRWIGSDISRWAIHLTRKRLLGLEGCRPFELLTLGKHERRYWQGVTFPSEPSPADQPWPVSPARRYVLQLYGAQPLARTECVHGRKGKALVHIGAVDSAVSAAEVQACIDHCLTAGKAQLHVLGWDWEPGLAHSMREVAKRLGIELLLLQIPYEAMDEQAVNKGDVRFIEFPHVEAKLIQASGRQVTVVLQQFSFPNPGRIPAAIRAKINRWSDYIDYWAVDWDFQTSTFNNGWFTFRTRNQRTLSLESDPRTYEMPGRYTIVVKVVDIFGHETCHALPLRLE